MRFCHHCRCDMQEVNLHGQTIDRCHACQGQFFDPGELASIVQIIRHYREIPLDEVEIDHVSPHEVARQVRCPHDGEDMEPQEIAGLTTDVRPACGGVWLEEGEIAALKLTEFHIRQNLQLYIRLGQ